MVIILHALRFSLISSCIMLSMYWGCGKWAKNEFNGIWMKWKRNQENENKNTNYCLLPSAAAVRRFPFLLDSFFFFLLPSKAFKGWNIYFVLDANIYFFYFKSFWVCLCVNAYLFEIELSTHKHNKNSKKIYLYLHIDDKRIFLFVTVHVYVSYVIYPST